MQEKEYQQLVMTLCLRNTVPDVLTALKESADSDIVEAAQSLAGQFALAEVEGEQSIYHVSKQLDDEGEEQEFVEHIMNEGEDIIKFVAWFFDIMFEVKPSDTYRAAGKTYRQPKRS
jgi:hypothetical protein